MNKCPRQSERGAALITVLMIIAAMSVVAIGLTQTVTSATQRARALESQAQLRLYAIAAEEVAEIQLSDLLQAMAGRLRADMPGLGEPQIFPVDGGLITVEAHDASNCFDLNSLVAPGENNQRSVVPAALQDYRLILDGVGIDNTEASSLASALVDWMDEDSSPGLGGAENGYYASEVPSYRTSSRPLANLTELRSIRGYTPEVIAALLPVVCVRPDDGRSQFPPPLNINTLTEMEAPLLSMFFSGQLAVDDARGIIAARPLGGWPDVETLLLEPAIAVIAPEQRRTDRLGLVTSAVEVYAEVAYRDQVINLQYLFETRPGRPVQALRRRRVG